jgi:hypothetical protein
VTAVKGADNRGELLAYADEVNLVGCRMVVKESRRQAIAAGGHREVCAWIIGKIGDPHMGQLRRVTFRPRERATVFLADTGEEVRAADAVAFDSHGNAWILSQAGRLPAPPDDPERRQSGRWPARDSG